MTVTSDQPPLPVPRAGARGPSPGAPGAAVGPVRLVCFQVAGQGFGVPIADVKETLVVRPITRVFLVPRFVAGIMNLRGEIVAVLDLALFLGLPASPRTDTTRIVIVKPAAGAGPGGAARAAGKKAGLLVDRLTEVRTVDLGDLAAPPPVTLGEDAAARGVATLEDGSPLVVLDATAILTSGRLAPFARKTQGAP